MSGGFDVDVLLAYCSCGAWFAYKPGTQFIECEMCKRTIDLTDIRSKTMPAPPHPDCEVPVVEIPREAKVEFVASKGAERRCYFCYARPSTMLCSASGVMRCTKCDARFGAPKGIQ